MLVNIECINSFGTYPALRLTIYDGSAFRYVILVEHYELHLVLSDKTTIFRTVD